MKNLHNPETWATTDASNNFQIAWKALGTAGLIASVDESLVWLLAERLAQYVALRDEADGKPFLLPLGSGSMAPNPIYKMRDETSKDVARLLRAVGMTPLSRRGLAKVRDAVRPGDKKDDWFMPTRAVDPNRWAHVKLDSDGRPIRESSTEDKSTA